MPAKEDLIGRVFGELSVIEEASRSPNGRVRWRCRCSCGNETASHASSLKNGSTVSCGCVGRRKAIASLTTHGHSGMNTPEYKVWESMRNRCRNPNNKRYAYYGGRGICVCQEWDSFQQFLDDMGPRPAEDYSIERIDNDGPYCKGNCRWASKKEQANNRRTSRWLTIDGETKTMAQWSEISGTRSPLICTRLKKGWTHKQAVFGKQKTNSSG